MRLNNSSVCVSLVQKLNGVSNTRQFSTANFSWRVKLPELYMLGTGSIGTQSKPVGWPIGGVGRD